MFGKEKPRKMYKSYWYRSYTKSFLSSFFILTSFDTMSLILSVKIILIRNYKSVTISSGLVYS